MTVPTRPSSVAVPASCGLRVTHDGKFFRLAGAKFYVKGVAYGPFAPNPQGEFFASPEQTATDFKLIRELGANLLRVYYVPPRWFLDLAADQELKVLVDVPWSKHLCFLDSAQTRLEARTAVRQAVASCGGHPALFGLSVVNEVPPDIVRWTGGGAVADFIEELIDLAKEVDPECLCTFGNYPPTEYLRPQNADFYCFNIYLHHPKPFENYLGRLQLLADSKPLLLGETGIDSFREGEERQADILRWQIELACRNGLAGAIVYSFTDDWFKGSGRVHDWGFGLTRIDRRPKRAFEGVQKQFQVVPYFPLHHYPFVSVVVACYNGARTLKLCLDSLQQLHYPAYEVILVDDGSTDATQEMASGYPQIRYLRHEINGGLSAARNTGVTAARGEIVAFTDADCRADEDWLFYLVGDLLRSKFVGIGGHNLLPPDDSWVAAAVMVSPGGPAHVMLTDRLAEHIPGCNMAFYKWALVEIGCFDPLFRRAGDDVDLCWRLQQAGYKIGFSPAGFVWHYRRSSVPDYLRQQRGYGEAEALLVRKHPEYFNWFGGGIWRGRIYSPAKVGFVPQAPMIYHGLFASGSFQSLYSAGPAFTLMLFTSLEYHALVALPLLVLGIVFRPVLPLAALGFLFSLLLCVAAAAQAELPRKKLTLLSRPLVALLFWLQPIVRGWARYRGHLRFQQKPLAAFESLDSLSLKYQGKSLNQLLYWNDRGIQRLEFLAAVLDRLERQGWQDKSDTGWDDFDVEIFGSRWSRLQLTTAGEAHGEGKHLIRCRLRPTWSWLSRLVFFSLLAVDVLALGLALDSVPWLWIILFILPAFVAWIQKKKRHLQRLVAVFLDHLAEELGFIKIETGARASVVSHK